MAQRVFWTEPYRTTLAARIASVSDDVVTLDRTILYAFSGGQESDHGTIGGHEVLNARLEVDEIHYTLPTGHGLVCGADVDVAIDWARRYRLMRLHFAAELILEVVCRTLPQATKIGAHIAADKARIDFESATAVTPLLEDIRRQALEVIAADRPIVSAFSDEAAGRRYWEVEGFARVACGGTHLRRTAEVGDIELKRRNVGRGKERIEIHLIESTRG